jgi:RNA polymerase sigma-70 factor, ECF subfamily
VIAKIRSPVQQLPAEQRKPLELAFFQGLTHSEIAANTGDPLGTVKTRIRAALLALRKVLVA